MKSPKIVTTIIAACAAIGLAAGCSSNGQGGSTDTADPATSAVETTSAPPADEPAPEASQPGQEAIEIGYIGWVPKAEEAVAIWNAANPDKQVVYSPAANGQEAYPKIRSSVQGGDGGCLAQLTLDQVPSFVADGILMDVTDYTADVKDVFLDWAWALVSPGGRTYAIPQDIGPIGMFYRTDLFEQFGIDVPATWDDFAAAAKKVHDADSSKTLTYLATDDSSTIVAYAWQRGATWFSIDGESWKVGINDAASLEAAAYWQGLIDAGEVVTTKRWAPDFYSELAADKYLVMIGAAWNSALIEGNVADQAGKWAVAPMPTVGGSQTTANSGGSAVAVLQGCKYPEAAVEFATWLNSSEDSMNFLAASDGGGLFPAAVEALGYPVVNQELSFFGGQKIAEVFAESAQHVDTDWAWGPTYSSTDTALGDGMAQVALGSATLSEVLASVQQATLDAMTERGIAAVAAE